MPGGRPSQYTPEMGDRICEQLAMGRPITHICREDGFPHYVTVIKWQTKYPEFAELSARAMEAGTHVMAIDALDIADRDDLDPADKRVRIDTRLRLIGKWNKRVYGDSVAHDVNVRRVERVEVALVEAPRRMKDVTPKDAAE